MARDSPGRYRASYGATHTCRRSLRSSATYREAPVCRAERRSLRTPLRPGKRARRAFVSFQIVRRNRPRGAQSVRDLRLERVHQYQNDETLPDRIDGGEEIFTIAVAIFAAVYSCALYVFDERII
jgi:hypothetical protein